MTASLRARIASSLLPRAVQHIYIMFRFLSLLFVCFIPFAARDVTNLNRVKRALSGCIARGVPRVAAAHVYIAAAGEKKFARFYYYYFFFPFLFFSLYSRALRTARRPVGLLRLRPSSRARRVIIS